jgi:predicted RNase H-like nuclease (RuvC/YqgF family)
MAQDTPDKKKTVSPDLLKLMMNEDEAEVYSEPTKIQLEVEAATRIVNDHTENPQPTQEIEVMKMDTHPRGAIQRGSKFATAEPTLAFTRNPSANSQPPSQNSTPSVTYRSDVTAGKPSDMTPLLQSEHMRIAQNRIKELEEVVESLRVDNEQLSSASETLKNRNDELNGKLENLESRIEDVTENANREKSFLETSTKSKSREISALKLKVEELESRLHQDLRKIRVRERELENIIEIVRAEHAAVILNKDEMILNLKRKVDDLMHQMDLQNHRLKDQDRASREEHEKVKRTVKGLRAALIMLEGDDQTSAGSNLQAVAKSPLKKAE